MDSQQVQVSEEAEMDFGNSSRRSFLKTALVGGTAAAVFAVAPRSAEAGINKKTAESVFGSIRLHENEHVNFLVSALGSAARPKPTFTGLQLTKKDYKQFLILSQTFENVGVSAYLGAAPNIESSAYLAAAGSIATVEARHAGVLNIFQDDPVTPDNASFDVPLTASDVVAAVTPFISSLNGGPAVSYSTVKSAQNDIDILNFALALEYLEAEFYNLNVPIFFKKLAI